jgi:hypothetical protein
VDVTRTRLNRVLVSREAGPVPTTDRRGLAALVVLVFLVVQCGGSQTQHLGEWSGADHTGVKGSFTFNKDGTGTLVQGNASVDFRYEINYDKRPIWLDLIITENGTETRTKSIIEFIETDTLRWRTFFNETRPTAFPEPDPIHTIVLTRVRR